MISEDTWNLYPNLGAETNEPSLRKIVFQYYAEHFPADKATELTERYFNALNAPQAPTVSEWIPVSERLPADEEQVWVMCGQYDGGEPIMAFAIWTKGEWWYGNPGTESQAFDLVSQSTSPFPNEFLLPTHWMPLPKAPSNSKRLT